MKVSNIVLVLLLGVSLMSCYERQEGCLDLLSPDYDLSADDACDDCCTYPYLQLRVFHMLGDSTYNRDSIIINAAGQEYKMTSAQIFLNDFDLTFTGGQTLNVIERSIFEDADEQQEELIDDHVVLTSSNSLIKAGTVRENGAVESVGFTMGVTHELISADDEGSIFSYDSLYTSEGYYDISLYLQTGPSQEIDKTVRIFLNQEDAKILLQPTDVSKIERVDLGLSVTIDYELFLHDIVIEDGTEVQIIRNYSLPSNLINLVQ